MNNTTNTTSSSQEPPTTGQAETMFKIVFYVALFLVGTIGNLLVVIIIRNKRQRTVNDYFIFNLAISDLTFLCFALPFYFYELFERFFKFQFYCKFIWPMMSVSLFVGIFTLTFMSVERCRAILFPFRPRIKKTTLFLSIALVWTASILCIVPLMIVANPEGTFCLEHWPNDSHRKAYTAALFILQFAVPITVIAVAYITIVIKLFKTKVPNRTSVNHRGQLIKQKHRTENIHIIRTVAIIVILFLACMLPNQIAWILMDFGGEEYKNLSEKFWLFAEALMFLHSCVNPIIYGSLTRQFREGYIKYINFICCCGRSAQKTMDFSEQRHYHDRQSNCSRPQGTLIYKGSLKSPSIIKRLGTSESAQAPTLMSSLTYRTSPSPPSPVQLSPNLLNNQVTPFQTNVVLQYGSCSGAVQVHQNRFPTFIPVECQDEISNHKEPQKDDMFIIAEDFVLEPEDGVRKSDGYDEKTPNGNLNSRCNNNSAESVVLENQMSQDLKPGNGDISDECTAITKHNTRNTDGSLAPEGSKTRCALNNNLDSKERYLMAGPSVNYAIMDDEEICLQDTHF